MKQGGSRCCAGAQMSLSAVVETCGAIKAC